VKKNILDSYDRQDLSAMRDAIVAQVREFVHGTNGMTLEEMHDLQLELHMIEDRIAELQRRPRA